MENSRGLAMLNPRFKTAKACEFARVDRMQFNEAIANGHYTCAAPTVKGSSRIFDLNQTVSLFIFGQLIRRGLGAREAGKIACQMYNEFSLSQYADYSEVATLTGIGGASTTYMISPNDKKLHWKLPAIGEVVDQHIFNVAVIRDHISQLAQVEIDNPILGSDE
jgi:hypothetical protein